ncbi:DUF4214 domain-containing protein [Vreelandella venusta]|uniref:DUF4214 domain-containing protein n=1 Tax=Vreelandella venusta TaxID=44935 RepID=UPI00200D731A|nr:DUF4214 domain-containing protein [Halomonas venusta]UQI40282.1 DUF4214 domain-containing protein [Halomonas venusta]
MNRFTEVAELSNGNLAFVWATGGSDYAMRRFEVDGTPFDNEQLSVTNLAGISGSQYQHNIAANDTGFIITWDAYNYNNYLGMLFDNDASMPTQVNGSNRFSIGDSIAKGNASQYVETLPNGNYLVLFKGATGDSSTRDVRYQIYDDSGNALLSSDTVIGGMNSWGDFSKPVILDDRLVVSYSYVDYNTDPTTIERYLVSYDFNGNLIEDLSSSIPTTQGEYGYVTSFVDVDGNLSWLVNDDDSGNDDYDTWLLRQSEVIPEGEVSNEAPTIILPSSLVFDENTSANAVSGLSITDGNADNQTVTLTATDGTINLANINGLTKVSGEYNSGFVTFSGELNDVNTALNSLTFTPIANVSGNNAASLSIQTVDGNGGSDSQTLEFNITDVDPIIDNNSFSVNKNSVNGTVVGTVTPSGDTNGLTFSITSGNESGAFAIDSNGQITVADDSQLNNNSYSLTVAVDDEDEDSTADDTASITISVNNPPTLTGVPTSITVAIGSISGLDLSAVSLADIDSDEITLEINTSSGTLAASSDTGVVVSGSDTNTLTLEGTPDAINTYLDTVSNIQYKPEDEGSGTTLTLRASDGEADSAIATSTINVNDLPTGDVNITGDEVEDATLTASNTLADENGLGMVTYQWLRDGNEITAATGVTYTLTQADVGAAISVRASYTDGQGTAEAVTSAATGSVANVNDAPTGGVAISGDAIEDETLTADTSALADEDGLGAFSYVWKADDTAITGATSSTYTLTQAEVGKVITVEVSYTDGQGTAEAVTSAATGSVANVNDAPTGGVAISGDAIEDETLTADTSALADEDGLGAFSYVWKADDTAITGATSSTYTLTQAEVGKAITVEVSYTDGQGTAEAVTSAATGSVANVNDAPTGGVAISGDAIEDETLTADTSALADEDGLGAFSYVWKADDTAITGATSSTYTLTQAEVGKVITVEVSYTDGQGTAEAVTSAATGSVANVNDAPTGGVAISGDAIEDETLTADTSALADEDGLGAFSYVWKADDTAITGATSSTYTLTQAEVGKAITVEVSYTDGQGTAEAVTSAATGSVANVNDAPAGDVIITGDAVEDETLTADTSALADEDGLGAFSYVWKADDTAITGATTSTYTLTQAEVGKAITVEVSYTDQQGTAEALTSAATESVANVNDAPAGDVIITGDAVEDQTLTVSNTLADEDGLGTLTYQWLRDGTEITDAIGETYTLTQADVGTAISVRASYTDQQGTAEAVTSATTESVANVNDAPTGGVVISGTATEDEVLTASNTLADEDGLGTVTYQWLRDGNEITDATGETYSLVQADVGAAISVRASYTDQQGTAEAVTSAATESVANVNDAPTGGVAISGDAIEDETLTADTSALVDEDGLGTFSYVWKADDTAITGATNNTYTLTQAEVGKVITVEVSYTDDQGTAEAVTSAATDSVANVNDAPTGDVSITGDAVEDQTLTASKTLADEDGLGAVAYQWLRDGNEITDAMGTTYTLTQADVGAAISVRASYTDQQGTAEAVTSATTESVANVNDAPTGDVIITGDAIEDETLTADTSALADEDGLGTFSYVWKADDTAITGATSSTYTLTQAEVGKAITVEVSYTDDQGTAEAVTSDATDSVANVNDAPTGGVAISGDAVEDQTLTASNTLADEDGLGTVTYQWLRDGNEITAAIGETYTLTQADVSAAISVRASYTDQQGTAEAVTSATTESVANVNDAPTGDVIITGDAVEDQTLTVSNTLADEDGLGAVTYQWLRDGNEITDATGETYSLAQADVGAAISVRASYTDQQGTAEAVTSAATESVANVNDAPTGGVAISGDAIEDETLTADTSALVDEDGLGTFSYVWKADDTAITGATSSTYTLTQAEVGKVITVEVSYTDDQGTAEAVTSATTESVANVNDAPTGDVIISGDAVEDQTLTVSNTLADEDGLDTVTYQWLRDGNEITDAMGTTYTLTQADVGAAISVRASYTDQQGTAEAVTSTATDSVANVNDAPTGDVIITGDAVEDQTLTVSNTLADEDGLGAVIYQWLRDGNEITAATGETYTLTQADVGSAISVRASYTDQQGTAEAVTSAVTESVANVNDAPTGDVIITGDAVEDQTLTVSNTLADEDGLGAVIYQWLRDGNEITAATGETYTLTQADVGAAISVRASYTDQQGTAEVVTSAVTESVANVNDAPTGGVTISGTATEDEVLTASNTLADEDGLGTVTYQWLRDGNEITAATGETYTLTQADVGTAISVRASYTDQQGTAEAVTSATTESVANVNDAPTGGVIISGDAVEDQTLTASNTLADEDGLGTVTYQWLRDGNEIAAAIGETYTLTQADVGAAISVRASYTDQQGTAEAITSATTESVANVNDAPTGGVAISGDAVEDQTLTASNTLADEDGMGTVTYQWLRDGNEIAAAIGETYTLTQADVGTAISVRASYTDQQGTAEALTSAATESVANVNDAPTGGVAISGDAVEDQTLTVSNTLADEDGLGTVTYQWLRDGNEIAAATGETYTLTQADVGAAISVRASYTDQQGTAEAVTSAATESVANVNDAPTGGVAISGDAVEDQTLTASNTLADEDGLGTVTYQWLRDGNEITDATGETYSLTQADVDAAISVRANYTDQQGTAETITSMPTSAISANPDSDNDGISNEDESRVPSLDGSTIGDGNGDGIPDAEQSNVSSIPFLLTSTAVSNPADAPEAFITLTSNGSRNVESDDDLLTLRNVRQLDAPNDRPDDLDMPFGLIAFEADIETVGGSHVFSLFVDDDVEANGYWKQNAAGDWVNLASAAFGGSLKGEGNKLRFDFVIEDGGEFDSDGVANGVIVDPGAIGFRLPETPEDPEPIPDVDDGGVNSAPIARDDEFSSRFGWLLRGNLLEDNGNGIDQEIDGDDFSITDIDGQEVLFDTALVLSSGATLTVQENGDFLYDQRGAFVPSQVVDRVSDTFEYSIEDSQGASSTATVSVELGNVTDTVEISVLQALYKVAFDREADATGLDYWSGVREKGVSMFDIADFFIESEEFTDDHGNRFSDDDYLTLLYANAFDRAPDADGFAYWSDVLEEPTVDHGDVMTYFATSEEMQVKHLAEGFIFA